MRHSIHWLAAGLAGLLLAASGPARAASSYPDKPIHIIVPTTAGGAADVMTRLIAQKMGTSMNIPIVVENKPGAGNVIGSDYVAKSRPDGYTLLMTYTDHVFNPFLYPSMPYDTVKDFTPVTQVGTVPMVVAVNPQVKAHTLKELIALAKSQPGRLNYASAGNGTSLHLAAVLFTSMAGIRVEHIPYKGTSPGMLDLYGGRVQFMFPTLVSVAQAVRDGKVRVLAVTSARRVPSMPDLPTVAEAGGLPGYEASIWYAVLAPAGTPRDVVARLNSEFRKALTDPEIRAHLAEQGFTVEPSTPEALGAKISAELDRWGKVIRQNGITLQ